MHYMLEIIMPPTDKIEEAVTEIMAPFNESLPQEDYNRNSHPFWDFWVIGGRFAGSKITNTLPQDKLEEFHQKLTEMKVTVSGLQVGKPTLSPASQIPMVDNLWKEFFPESKFKNCPLFAHANKQYDSSTRLVGDVMTLEEVPASYNCHHCIIAGPNYDETGLQAQFMIETSMWNGVNHVDTKWDGTIGSALKLYAEKLKHRTNEWKAKTTPQKDWLVVTVDYHS